MSDPATSLPASPSHHQRQHPDPDSTLLSVEELLHAALNSTPESQCQNSSPTRFLTDQDPTLASVSSQNPADVLRNAQDALDLNRKYQASLRNYLKEIETAQRRLAESQIRLKHHLASQVRTLNEKEKSIVPSSTDSVHGMPLPTHRGKKTTAVPLKLNIFRYSYFVDSTGSAPDDNLDTILRRQEPWRTLQHRSWSLEERESLAIGVQQQNIKYLLASKRAGLDEIQKMTKEQLSTIVEDIDWSFIQKAYVPGRDPISLKLYWVHNESPATNHSAFTEEENQKLMEIAEKYGGRRWVDIASEMGTNRPAIQYFKQYKHLKQLSGDKRKWTPNEDNLLRDAIAMYGEKNWAQVSAVVNTRSCRQCLHRWKAINPELKRGKWSKEEDMLLLSGISMHGRNWSEVAKYVPGRSDSQCRERYLNVILLRSEHSVTPEEFEKLEQLVAQHGPSQWKLIAKSFPGRSAKGLSRLWESRQKRKSRSASPEVVTPVVTEPPRPKKRGGRKPRSSVVVIPQDPVPEPQSTGNTSRSGRKRRKVSEESADRSQ